MRGRRRWKRFDKPAARAGRPRLGWFAPVAIAAGLATAAMIDPAGNPAPTAPRGLEAAAPMFAFAGSMPICGRGRRVSCVVDGDTFWIAGEKVRMQGIDAPEVNGACSYETRLAERATRRLSELLSREPFSLVRGGTDRYGRTLARVETRRGEAGELLVREGLARVWTGRRESWCG